MDPHHHHRLPYTHTFELDSPSIHLRPGCVGVGGEGGVADYLQIDLNVSDIREMITWDSGSSSIFVLPLQA